MRCWSGTKYKKPHSTFDVGLTDGTEAFLELLEQGPLWVSRYVKAGSYHITVARKYDDDGKGSKDTEPSAKRTKSLKPRIAYYPRIRVRPTNIYILEKCS